MNVYFVCSVGIVFSHVWLHGVTSCRFPDVELVHCLCTQQKNLRADVCMEQARSEEAPRLRTYSCCLPKATDFRDRCPLNLSLFRLRHRCQGHYD